MEQEEKYKLIVARDYTEEQFREMWKENYCQKQIFTHDGVRVHFYDNNFDHAFFESSVRNSSNKKKSKDILSLRRLSRMLWIKDVLQDEEAEMYVGYNSKSKLYDNKKRVSVVKGDYVVVIEFYKLDHAKFITAYVADNSIGKIKTSPRWGKSKKKNAD